MSLAMLGLSHHTCPLALRERMAFPQEALPRALNQLHKRLDGAGVVLISTCNRVELYAHHPAGFDRLVAEMRGFLSDWHGVPGEEFAEYLYEYADEAAAGHLFRVAASLDSLVVGEGQILGQVHDAFLASQAEQTTDKVIHALFQKAFAVAKKVRSTTNIGQGKVSIGSVAVDLAASIFMDLADKSVLIIGSGKMGESTLRNLIGRGVGHVLIANRSQQKAERLAAEHRGEVLPFERLESGLHRADIVISSTASPDFVLGAAAFHEALKKRNQEPMFVIDIAVPRDIDPAINAIDDIYLYDIDDLREVAEANLKSRRAEIARSLELVDEGVAQFMQWLRGLAAEPTLVSLAEELHAIRELELEKTFGRLPDLSEAQRKEVEYLTQRIINTILQRPMTQLKREMVHEDPHTVLHLVKRLFGLKEIT